MQSRSIRRSGQPTWATALSNASFDRDLIRGGHYGQRSCEPHENMAAPTNAALVKKALANSEPSTHGPSRRSAVLQQFGRFRSEADIQRRAPAQSPKRLDPQRT